MLGELEDQDRIVVGDLEAGLGTLLRLEQGQADLVLVVVQPTAKSIDVAARALSIVTGKAPAMVVANRIHERADVDLIRATLGPAPDLVVVPEDAVISRADELGTAPIDAGEASPGVEALVALADRIRAS